MKITIAEGTPSLADWSLPAIDAIDEVASAVEKIAFRMAEEAIRHALKEESNAYICEMALDEGKLVATIAVGIASEGESLYVDIPFVDLIKECAAQGKDYAEELAGQLRRLAGELVMDGGDDR